MTQPPPPPPPPEDPVERYGTIIAVLAGILVVLLIALVIVLVNRDGDNTGAPDTSTTSSSTTTSAGVGGETTSSTTAPLTTTTTAAPPPPTNTTTAPPPTTTTTIPPFDGTLDPKSGTLPAFLPARVAGIRFADHGNYTRVVFDLEQGETDAEPFDGSFFVGYGDDPLQLLVTMYPVFYSGDAVVPVGIGSVERVESTGEGAGSGEWGFAVGIAPDGSRPFKAYALDDPRRLVVDIGY